MTSRLLVEAGFAQQYNKWRREQFEWNERKNAFNDLATGVATGAFWITGNQPETQRTFNASASYVTGSHNIKVGMQNRWGGFTLYNGPHPGDMRIHYTIGGVPAAVVVMSTPLDGFKAEINHDIGLFAQDTWTINRWTFNLGVRADIFKNGNPPQVLRQARGYPLATSRRSRLQIGKPSSRGLVSRTTSSATEKRR